MKRLALLLAAMGIVSVGAMAEAPKLEATNFGQEIEIENSDGGTGDIDSIYFANTVGLKYGTWSFAVQGGKFWSWDSEKGFKSENARLQIDVWKQVTDGLKLGYRLRAQDEYDRHYARWTYTNGIFWSAGDVWYESTNQSETYGKDGKVAYENDWAKAEVYPVGLQYGDLKVGYFLNYEVALGDVKPSGQEDKLEHQIRVYYPLYTGEKFSLNFEGRFTIAEEKSYKKDAAGNDVGYRHYDDFGRTRLYLRPSYKVSDALTVYGYYGYEFKDYKYENGKTRADYHKESDNYQDIGIGWNYTF